jgi:hypothetical protein
MAYGNYGGGGPTPLGYNAPQQAAPAQQNPSLMQQLSTPGSSASNALITGGLSVLDAGIRGENVASSLGRGALAGYGAYQGTEQLNKEKAAQKLTGQKEEELMDMKLKLLQQQLQGLEGPRSFVPQSMAVPPQPQAAAASPVIPPEGINPNDPRIVQALAQRQATQATNPSIAAGLY